MELNDSLTNLLLCFILSLKFVPDTTVNADLNNFILESPDVNLRFFYFLFDEKFFELRLMNVPSLTYECRLRLVNLENFDVDSLYSGAMIHSQP